MENENEKAAENAAVAEEVAKAAEAAKAAAAEEIAKAAEAAKAEEAAKAADEEKTSTSGVMDILKKKARSIIPVRKTLVVVKDDDGKYECELHKFSANISFKKAALSALFDKADEGEISIKKRSEVQYDLIVNGMVAYSAVEV